MKRWRSLLKLILKNIAVLFFLLLLVEIILHIIFINTSKPKYLQYASLQQIQRASIKPRYSPHRYLGYYPTPDWSNDENRHNSLGFRGNEITPDKPKDTFRIVCIGGSTTYTTAIDDFRTSYPFLLEELLNKGADKKVEVINAGVGNWTTWESLINLQLRLVRLQPDLVVVYHSTNDIESRMVWPPESYLSDNTGRRISNHQNLTASARDVLLEKSNILRILGIRFGIKSPNTSLQILDRVADTYYFREFNRQLNRGVYPSGIFKEVPVQKMLEVNKPIYFEENLEHMINIATGNNFDIMLVTFAHCSEFESQFSSRPEFEYAYAEHNQLIKKVALDHNIPCLDFAGIFPDEKAYYSDGRHVNEKGSHLKAEIFAEFIHNEYMSIDENE